MSKERSVGWDVFDSDKYGLEIERIDEDEIFDSDEEAKAHVYAQPLNPSEAPSYRGAVLYIEGNIVAECHNCSPDIWMEIVKRWNAHCPAFAARAAIRKAERK